MRRALVGLAMAALTVAVAGCSSHPTGKNSCGGGPVAAANGQQPLLLASCAGAVGMSNPAPSLTVEVGTVIRLTGLTAPGYTSPASSQPDVVTVTTVNPSTAELRAASVGTALVTLATPYCLVPSPAACPALTVTVIGAG